MHEASLVESLLEQVQTLVSEHGGGDVEVVEVEIGPLSGVEPELVDLAFQRLASGYGFPSGSFVDTPRSVGGTMRELRRRGVAARLSLPLSGLRSFRPESDSGGRLPAPADPASRYRDERGSRRRTMNPKVITVARDVLAATRADAEEFRELRSRAGTLVVNVLSSPGSGKTSLLQATARHWQGRFRMAVLVGDLATDRDANVWRRGWTSCR